MATLNITKDNFEDTIQNNDMVILDCWADWCGPCKAFGPVYEEASKKHDEIVFGKIDTENQKELAASFGIRSIPTVIVFKEQIPIFMQAGALPAEAFDELVGKVKTVDMNDVRAEIEKQKEKEAASNA